MEKLLEIKDLYVNYNTDESVVHALNGFSLDIYKGETLGLVGETGAGKTTMCLSVLRLLPEQVGEIVSGEIKYRDLDILKASNDQMRELRGAEVSMIFQDPMTSLNPIMTVGDQIKEVLDLHYPKMDEREKGKRVDDILSLVGIMPERKDQYPHQFSGGMKQRVVIAMALVSEPKLMLADEPTTALDVTIQAQILALMKELKVKFDSAMVLVTHDLGIVAKFCDSVAVTYAGAIEESGTIEQVFTRKENHPYTTGLFHCIPDLTSKAPRLTPIPGYMPDPRSLPKGCKFADRCTKCKDKCREMEPHMHEVEPGHFIKCWFSSEGSEEK
ncbi:MAG: ABC transporter ATP-binding protein [Eubacteriales bacterium]|nr:ABC transporter ATP-binding protein [Eubacteriales bacterium]